MNSPCFGFILIQLHVVYDLTFHMFAYCREYTGHINMSIQIQVSGL